MELIGFILFLILIALWRLGDVVKNRDTATVDLDGVEEKLEKIFRILGGEEKLNKKRAAYLAQLKNRVVTQLVAGGKDKGGALKEAEKVIKDALNEERKFEEERGLMELFPGSYSRLSSIASWVQDSAEDKKNKKKYGHLLPEAKKYVSSKIEGWKIKVQDLEKTLGTDHEGGEWLIKKLVEKNLLEEDTEDDGGTYRVKYLKVDEQSRT